MERFNIPIVFIIYNRELTTRKVFDVIKQVRPSTMYVISDAAKNEDDAARVAAARNVISEIDWDCNVYKNYARSNMGCGVRVASGLDWVFEREEYAIILEDDCVPDITFFEFCKEMLTKYKDDERIMYISGNNFHSNVQLRYSYDFVKIGWIWGWATWRRAWNLFDYDVKTWDYVDKNNLLEGFYNKEELEIFKKNVDVVAYSDKLTIWDYQWQYANAINHSLCIIPCVNLVNNIGFDSNATHTNSKKSYYNGATKNIAFPLVEPEVMIPNKEYDRMTLIHLKGYDALRLRRVIKKSKIFVKKILNKIYKRLVFK